MVFNHLHCHTQFSLLDGAAPIKELVKKAANDGMKAVAITDHGNMFGVFQFVKEAKDNNIKPIVGCEFYMVEDRHKKQFTKPDKDVRYHQLLLAKNKSGYRNLSKLCSLGWIEGKYGSYPRIDKELILKYHEGLIATTCCLAAEVPRTILRKGEAEAEAVFKWWLDVFGDDYFVELQRHGIPEQEKVNEVLVRFSKKYSVPIIASNDSHYVNVEDAGAHEILLAINTGSKMSDPSSKDFEGDEEAVHSGRKRFAFFNDQFYFKSTAEMTTLFKDLPQAIDNTNLVVDKVEELTLKQDILLPNFPIPAEFKIHPDDTLNQWEYLKHISYEGAKKRYIDIDAATQERIDFELFIIKTMGFAGYFLIVADFIRAGKEMGVFVGPGRGSAAGSVIAYCIGITNIDPIKYNLLFERFLNPDRKSMPDIDTDFDDAGRQKVIDYVVDKYGKLQVAQIVTYSTMAAKTSIKDVARVLDLPLEQSIALTKLVPDKGGSLQRLLKAPLEGEKSLVEKEGLAPDDIEKVKVLRSKLEEDGTLESKVLQEAAVLEGSVRGTGVHAAGIIIAPSDLTELMPMATAKDTNFLLTQYEGSVIEDAGVIKMDFLGLKTLTIIKNTLKLIKLNYGLEFDINEVDLTDAKTLELFQRGETHGIFQFESPGMQKYMKELKPDKFEDIIAMNALYRPGPLEYIPNYIKRKHGLEAISYPLPEMEEILSETYGITVYQEQVMLLSQKLAGFTKGDADVLRKAMGKKDRKKLDELKPKFIEMARAKNHPAEVLEKIWTDWEAFAQYAFNKSHSTCYAFVAFQTAWLKAHYPAEFMAANLTNEKDNIEKLTFFLEECKRMNLKVLGPDINESILEFSVNKQGQIRFGLGAIKGAGEAASQSIIEEREKKGPYQNIFEFAARQNLRVVNKKTFESFAYGGAFDCFKEMHRAMFFHKDESTGSTFIEKVIRHAQQVQELKSVQQNSLFGSVGNEIGVSNPKLPECDTWGEIEKLRLEKDVVGFYISGHPLDEFKLEFANYVTCTLDKVENQQNKEVFVAGVVTSSMNKVGKNGKPFGAVRIEDYTGNQEFMLFGDEYLKHAYLLRQGNFVFMKVKVQESFRQIGKWEMRPLQIELLQDVRSKRTKKVKIWLNVGVLNQEALLSLLFAVKEHPGTCELQFFVNHTDMNVELVSRLYKVSPSNEFFRILDTIEGLKYAIA